MVGKHSVASSGEGHDLGASLDKAFLVDLLEGPPDTLHELGVHGFVVIVEVDPTTESIDDMAPFARVSHDDLSTHLVVALHSELLTLEAGINLVDFVDFVLNGEAVAIPSEPAFA